MEKRRLTDEQRYAATERSMKHADYKESLEDFKAFWNEFYGDVDVEIHDEVFLIFLRKYWGDFGLTAEELCEFCSLDENDPEYDEMEGKMWI